MAKEIAELFVFKSDSSSASYQTLMYVDASLSCDCKGWCIKKQGQERTCKHVRYVEAGLGEVHAVKHVVYREVTQQRTVVVAQQKRVLVQTTLKSRLPSRRIVLDD